LKNVVLDIGNVISLVDFTPLYDLCLFYRISKEDAYGFLESIQINQDLGRSKPIVDEFMKYFKVKFSPADKKEFMRAYNSTLTICHSVVHELEKLVDNQEIGITFLSNMGYEHRAHVKDSLNKNGFFDKCTNFFSCDLGVRKPDLLMFDFMLRRMPELEGAVYIDDNKRNLEAGLKMGLQSEYFNIEDYYKVHTDVDQIGRINRQLVTRIREILGIGVE
jgi:FMN phosphatase YigB (HAD superfamily)